MTLLQAEAITCLPTDGSAVEMSYGGTPVAAGQFGGWTPIGAAQTASGYEVAWSIPGADQYTIFYPDDSGNYVSSASNSVSGRARSWSRSRPVSTMT